MLARNIAVQAIHIIHPVSVLLLDRRGAKPPPAVRAQAQVQPNASRNDFPVTLAVHQSNDGKEDLAVHQSNDGEEDLAVQVQKRDNLEVQVQKRDNLAVEAQWVVVRTGAAILVAVVVLDQCWMPVVARCVGAEPVDTKPPVETSGRTIRDKDAEIDLLLLEEAITIRIDVVVADSNIYE